MSPAGGAAPDRLAAESDRLRALRRIAAKGAYAMPADPVLGPDGDFAVFSPRNGFAQALAIIPAAAFAWARAHGWIEGDQAPDRYRIASAGIKALRRAKSGQSVSMTRGRSRARPVKKGTGHAPTSMRAAPEGSLVWLHRRRDKDGQPLITEPQFAAGERLGADYWHAQLSPRVTADWSGISTSRRMRRATPGVGAEMGDHVVAARQRIHRALDAVGPELAGILVDVCCHEVGLEAAGRAQGWPQRAAKVVLQLALTSLARHYGLLAPEPRPGAPRLRHWGSEDYRPDIEVWR
jgi:Domain of unknown function (DUF6456)